MNVLHDWLFAFRTILTKPSSQSFEKTAKKASGKTSSIIVAIVCFTVFIFVHAYFAENIIFSPSTYLLSLIGFPLLFFLTVFWMEVFRKKLFRRKKSYYDELLFIVTVVLILFGFISSLLSIIPGIGRILSIMVNIYQVVLIVIALSSITNLKIWHSILTVTASMIVTVGSFSCILAFMISMIGTVPRVF